MMAFQVDVRSPVVMQADMRRVMMSAFRVLVEEDGHCEQQKKDSNTNHGWAHTSAIVDGLFRDPMKGRAG